jgi:hypothetical protein
MVITKPSVSEPKAVEVAANKSVSADEGPSADEIVSAHKSVSTDEGPSTDEIVSADKSVPADKCPSANEGGSASGPAAKVRAAAEMGSCAAKARAAAEMSSATSEVGSCAAKVRAAAKMGSAAAKMTPSAMRRRNCHRRTAKGECCNNCQHCFAHQFLPFSPLGEMRDSRNGCGTKLRLRDAAGLGDDRMKLRCVTNLQG